MPKRKRFRLSILLELFLDAVLLLGFIIQAFVVGCLLVYGYLPLPANLVNQLINEKAPEDLSIQIEECRLHTNGTIHAIGISVRASHIKQSLFEAKSAEVNLAWMGLSELPELKSFIITGGTLSMPAIYSPSGYNTPLLERIALRIQMNEAGIEVDRFAALHDTIRLRGAIQLPPPKASQELDPADAIHLFYTQVGKILQKEKYTQHLLNPTITFDSTIAEDGSQKSFIIASSQQLDHPSINAEKIQIKAHLNWDKKTLSTTHPPILTASSISIPRYKIEGEGLSAQIPANSIATIFKGDWPQVQLSAGGLSLERFNLDAPILTVDPSELPQIQFYGATRSLNGAIDLRGQLNTDDWSGKVRARGSVDLAKLVNESIADSFPEIQFGEAPDFDILLNFNENLSLRSAELAADVNNLTIDNLRFDHIRANGSFEEGIYSIDDLYLRRQDQWLDLKFRLDTQTNDYRAELFGSAVPYDYNSILPSWWEAIFLKLDFSKVSYSLGDFIIYGNTKRKASDLYYGRVHARGVSYSGVFLDEGELIVRGRGSYTELHQLSARSGKGWAQGNISFASNSDEIKGPVSVRLDMDAKLTLEDAAKLFGEDIAQIIHNFETESLPHVQMEAAIFNKEYPQYQGKSYFDLRASCDQAVTYNGIPLDHLKFDLYGRNHVTYLREMEFGYADGQGQATMDVRTPPDGESSVRYKLKLVDSDQNQLVKSLPQLDNVKDSLGTEGAEDIAPEQREESRADINVYGEGPTSDIFAHKGYGTLEIRSEKLGTIQLLGPLSRLLQNTQLNFTSFNLNILRGEFEYSNEFVEFKTLQIDGPMTKIQAPGKLNLLDQSLDMRIKVNLFKNVGDPTSTIRKIGEFIGKPIPNLLAFEVTGTIQKQKIRSLYDPRNLLPSF